MVPLGSLWLPIALAAVIVFVASVLVWMVLPHHKSDWKSLPDEAAFREAMRRQKVTHGQYGFPHCKTPKEMQTPEMVRKFEEGPVGFLVLKEPGKPAMGKPMVYQFLYFLVISFFVAYITSRTVAPGREYLAVFRVAGTAAILAYAGAIIPDAIWFGHSWSSKWKGVLDGVLYGLLTAGVFGWLWPR